MAVMFDVIVLGKVYSPLIYTKLHRILRNCFLRAIGCGKRQYGPTPYRFLHRISIRIQICWFGVNLLLNKHSLFSVCVY
jgi:hypothetical protein